MSSGPTGTSNSCSQFEFMYPKYMRLLPSSLYRQPSYAGITGETYVGTDRREPGTVTLQGNWKGSR